MQDFRLKHYFEFKEILANYHISERAHKALKGLPLVLLVAPTSTGRNTLIRHLQKTGKYYFIVSDTTRPPQLRDGKMESNGVEYYFRSEEEVLSDLKKGEFLEAAIIHEQQVSGISIRELEQAKKQDKVAITDIETIGADNVIRAKPDTKIIFLLPPSFDEWQRRIRSRGKMSEAEIRNRLLGADKEFKAALAHGYYQFVVAEDIDNSVKIIDEIVHGNANPHQNRGRKIVAELHQRLVSLI